MLVTPAPAAASPTVVPRPPLVNYVAELEGTDAYIGIAKRGTHFKAYVSDATAKRVTRSVWFWGHADADGRLSTSSHGLRLDAHLERGRGTGTVTLPDDRVLPFTATSGFGGGLVDRGFRHAGVRYRSGWIVRGMNEVRGRTTVLGTAFDGSSANGPGIRPTPLAGGDCTQLREDYEVLRVQRGRLSHQSGRWELRLNRGRGSAAAYRRLNDAR